MALPRLRLPFDSFLDRRLGRRGRWILLAVAIGVVSGLGAILFDVVFEWAQWGFLEKIGHFRPPGSGIEAGEAYGPDGRLWLLASLALGGLISGILVFAIAPEAEGHGTDAVLHSFHHARGKVRRRVAPLKAITSAITIGSGGSAGREGPIAQIGASFGSFLGDVLKLTNHDRRIMMMAGMAGGIGSIFRAPLGAALFAAESLYSKPEFEYEVLLPGLISAITGYSIYSSYAGWGYLFHVPDNSFHEPRHLVAYLGLGVLCSVVGAVYPKIFYGMRDRFFRRIPLPNWVKPAIGASLLGGIALVFPEALGIGYGYIQQAIDGERTLQFLLIFAGVKIVATSLTISSGGSGGVFGPSLVIGGALGAAYGQAAVEWIPSVAPDPAACVMVGMGGFFAGVAKTPFASVIMVVEMTGSYGLLVPCLMVATITYLLLPLGSRLYENQLPSRLDSPAHTGSFAADVLRKIRVGDVWDPEAERNRAWTVKGGTTLQALVDLAGEEEIEIFTVVDDAGRLQGELSLDGIRRALLADDSEEGQAGLNAEVLMRDPTGPLTPRDNLETAAKLLATRQSDSLTVVADRDDPRVLGLFSRRDLIVGYATHLEQSRHHDALEVVSEADPF